MSKILEVLVIGPSPNGLKGGQVTHLENIRKAFAEKGGIGIRYFYSSSGRERTEGSVIKAIRLVLMLMIFPFSLFSIDVVHLNSSFDNKALARDFFLLLWCFSFGKAVVVQYHGGNPQELKLVRHKLIRNVYRCFWRRWQVLVLTDAQKDWFVDLCQVSSLKMKNYVEFPECVDDKQTKTFRFVYMGRVIKEKGIPEIIEAAKIMNVSQSFVIDIYGAGEDAKELETMVREADLESVVTFKGSVSGDAKLAMFKNTDVFLYPSYYSEGLPYSILEALSYKLTVICTDAGALKDLLEDGENCLKVEMRSPRSLADAMQRVITDEPLRVRLSSSGRLLIKTELSLPVLKLKLTGAWTDAAA